MGDPAIRVRGEMLLVGGCEFDYLMALMRRSSVSIIP